MSGLVLYHGTRASALPDILRDGLRPRSDAYGNWANNPSRAGLVYLSSWAPMFYAGYATQDEDDLLILRVHADKRSIYPDEDFLDLSGVKNGDPIEYREAWRQSLNLLGMVASRPVPSARILDHIVVPWSLKNWSKLGGDVSLTPLAYKLIGKPKYIPLLELLFKHGLDAALAFDPYANAVEIP